MNSITTPRIKPPAQDQSFKRFFNATMHHQIKRQTRLRKAAEAENAKLKEYIPSYFEMNAIFGDETDCDPYAP